MKMGDVTFVGKQLTVGSQTIEFEYPIADAFLHERGIIILFDPDSYKSRFGQFQNLICIQTNGDRIWTADLPTTTSGDRYYRITSREPLVALSVQSFECNIDPATGRIVSQEFFK